MHIKSTKNYDSFKQVIGNRSLNQLHIKRLAQSLKSSNFLEFHPVIVNEKMEVIDGQHRIEAAKLADKEIFYVVKEGARLSDVILLNSLNKAWSMNDYLLSFIEKGKRDYIILSDFCTKYHLSLSVGLEMLVGNGTLASKGFKEGRFQVRDLAFGVKAAELLERLRPYCENETSHSKYFSRVLMKLLKVPNFSVNNLVKKVIASKVKIRPFANVEDGLRHFEGLYNSHKQYKIRFF